MMKSSMLRSHLVAAAYGLIFALFCGLVALALQPFPFYIIFMMPPMGLLWGLAFYSIPSYLGVVLARGLAKRLGAHDLFALLAGVMAWALGFSFDFATSIRSWLSSTGEKHGTILGPGPPPEAVEAWVMRGLSLACWIGLMLWGGIAWKRAREKAAEAAESTPWETAQIFGWLILDSLLIGCVMFAVLSADLAQRREWSNPENVFDRAVGVLNDKGASPGDRALALNTIEHSRNDRAFDLLQRAVQEETGDTRLYAAASLIGHDDLLALSALEDSLMGRTPDTGTILPTTSHTPSEGTATTITGFGHIGKMGFGNAVSGVKDPATAPILVHLMTSPLVETRRGAASALRHIMTLKERGWDRWVPTWPDSVDVAPITNAMIAGLDDPDEMVRYFSVCTLMEINLNPHYPAVFLFKDHEAEYVDGWKAWAKTR